MKDENNSEKPQREVTASLLEAFDLIKETKDDLKVSGGIKLISRLTLNENEKELQYALKRLIRSVGANVPEIRMGYFASLVSLLSKFNQVTVTQILDLIKKELHANGSSKSEVGDVALGQILVYSAIFRSGLMLKCTDEEQKEILQNLKTASGKKSYLSTVASLILLDFINEVSRLWKEYVAAHRKARHQSQHDSDRPTLIWERVEMYLPHQPCRNIPCKLLQQGIGLSSLLFRRAANILNEEQFATIVWPNIKQDYKKELKDHTLDSLHFLLVISSKFPAKVKLRKLIGVSEILHEDNLSDICDKLMTGVDFNLLSHPIYNEIGKQIAKSQHLMIFWNKIDSQLVKHNRNRELVSLNMLNTIFLNIEENFAVIPDLLSDNFFKLFMDWFKGLQTASKIRNKRDNEDDHKIMVKKQKEVLASLAKVLKLPSVNSTLRVATLKKLLFNPGEINFTEITGSTVVKSIIADLDADGLKKMAKLLKKVLLNTSKKFIKENVERNWYNNERVKAAELLSFIVSHEALKDDTEFKITYMQLLMCFGFFRIGGDENVAVSSELAASIKTCFYRCFTSRFSNVDNLVTVLSSLTTFISNITQKPQVREKLDKQFPKENMECWEMLIDVCQKLQNNESKSKVDNVFLILLYQLGLFLFSEPSHVKIARSAIIELKSCYDHYRKGKKKKPKPENTSDDAPEWVEVMVEVLLSILSIESSVLRSVVQCVFRLLWEYLTPSSIGQIVSVLDPESESNPLTQDSDSEGDDDDDDDDKGDSDKEISKENGDDSGDEESDEGDSEMDDDQDMKVPDQLRLAVQKALGSAATPDTDAESIDADMISEEEGKKLDDALAEAFKQFNQGKNIKTKKDRKNKKALSDFRIRVLDLIDIYLEKDPAMDICLSMIAPLTRCLEFCMLDNQFKELENRVRKSIKNLTKIRKFSTVGDISIDILGDFLKSVIDKGERSHFMFQALGDVITHFAIFIIYCSQKVDNKSSPSKKKKKTESPIIEILKEAVENYFNNRNCLLPIIFFHNVLQTEWDGKYELVPVVVTNVFDTNVRQFRRNEGLNLMFGFYQALNRFKPTSEQAIASILNIEKVFNKSFADTFKTEAEIDVKANYLTTLKKLINIMKVFHDNCKHQTVLDFKSLSDKLTSVKVTNKTQNKNEMTVVKNKENGIKSKKKKKNKRKVAQANGDHLNTGAKRRKKDSVNSE